MGVLASESLYLHRIAEGLVKTRGGKKTHVRLMKYHNLLLSKIKE